MNTIEERAKEYAPDIFNPYEISPATEGYIVRRERRAYTQGATDQQKIDIEKACEWLKARNVLTEEGLEGFRKAMEE